MHIAGARTAHRQVLVDTDTKLYQAPTDRARRLSVQATGTACRQRRIELPQGINTATNVQRACGIRGCNRCSLHARGAGGPP